MEKREVGGKFSSQVSNLGEGKAEATSRRELVQSRTRPGNSDSLSPSAEQLLILPIHLRSHLIDLTCVSVAPSGGSIL